MMKRVIVLSFFLPLLLVTACYKSNTVSFTADQILEHKVQTMMESYWQDYLTEHDLQEGGLLFHAQHGTMTVFTKSNLSDDISKHSLFRAASIAKTFTASAIMILQQNNDLSIDHFITANMPGRTDPYVPDTPEFALPYKEEITIRQLLEHSAGVFDLTNFDIPDTVPAPYAGQNWIQYMMDQNPAHYFTVEEIFAVLSEYQLSFNEPGDEYNYSNTGYMLLGKIIERVSGMSYEQFIQKKFLIPNSLNSIGFPLDPEHTLPSPYIPCYVYWDSQVIDADVYNMSFETAQGNLVANSADLLTWLMKWQKGRTGLSMDTVLQMRQSSFPDQSYGLGTDFYPGFGYGHTGALAGYVTIMLYDPATDFGFVMLSNMWNINSMESFNQQAYTMFDIAAKAKQLITESREGSDQRSTDDKGAIVYEIKDSARTHTR